MTIQRRKELVILIALFIFSATTASSQLRNDWQVFKSPCRSFAVRLPEIPKMRSVEAGENGEVPTELRPLKFARSVNLYSLPSIFGSDNQRLIIQEIDVSGRPQEIEGVMAKDISSFLKRTVRKSTEFHRDKVITFDGFSAREILYHSGDFYKPKSPIYNRILLILTRSKLLVVSYFRKEGTIGEEEDIFRSFKVNDTAESNRCQAFEITKEKRVSQT